MHVTASDSPLVSVIVNNYNYGRYLDAAIGSALVQTYPHVEVIVVDDGSTDESRDVIASYGTRIRPVLKENGGQASAFNVGFASSKGDLILFLDADDILLPDTVIRAVQAFRATPGTGKVLFRVEVMTAAGPTGRLVPDACVPMPFGLIRDRVLRFPDDIAYPATSGNMFARDALEPIFPLPTDVCGRVGADVVLYSLTSLTHPIVSVDRVGAYYRAHAGNHHLRDKLDLAQVRSIILRSYDMHVHLKRYADTLGYRQFPADPTRVRSVTFQAQRMISRKLDPENHPIEGDRPFGLALAGAQAALGRYDLPPTLRVLYVLWFFAMVAAPRPAARVLIGLYLHPRNWDWLYRRRPKLPA